MIAFHYPPCVGSSGVLRTLKFSRYLPDHDWQPIVLTAHPRAYLQTSPEQLAEVPTDVPVTRAFALDAGRHLAIRGSSLRVMAQPDRWVSWWLGAVPAGLQLALAHRPAAIWSTYPIATAHLIGWTLHRLTGVPWVADLRDSMTDDGYPPDDMTRWSYRHIERRIVRDASLIVFTTGLTREMYLRRHPALAGERSVVIPNGYDETDFRDLAVRTTPSKREGPVRLVHAGQIHPEERDPRPLFRALARLKREDLTSERHIRVELLGSGAEVRYAGWVRELGIEDLVSFLPVLPYRKALQECADADALLLLQGRTCNHQIPAKVYEYLRIGRPILALTAQDGDTARLLRQHGGSTIVDLLDEEGMYKELPRFLESLRTSDHPSPDRERARSFTRQSQARELATCLSSVTRGKQG